MIVDGADPTQALPGKPIPLKQTRERERERERKRDRQSKRKKERERETLNVREGRGDGLGCGWGSLKGADGKSDVTYCRGRSTETAERPPEFDPVDISDR